MKFKAILKHCIDIPEPYKGEIFPRVLYENLASAKNIGDIFALPRKDQRIFLIYGLRNLLSPKEYGRLLIAQWHYSKTPSSTFGPDTLQLWQGIPRECMMTKREMRVFDALPSIVTIYRGVIPKNELRKRIIRGFSWTLDKDKAHWFAVRFAFNGDEGTLVTATIPKEHIAFYTDGRSEREIVVNPKFLKIKSQERVQG